MQLLADQPYLCLLHVQHNVVCLLAACLLQAAVPKYMQLRLEPASSTVLAALGGSASQKLHVVNSMVGQKPLVMRLRVNYSKAGQPISQQLEVNNFPAGL
jgi:AP-1 complex subunit gamma-1